MALAFEIPPQGRSQEKQDELSQRVDKKLCAIYIAAGRGARSGNAELCASVEWFERSGSVIVFPKFLTGTQIVDGVSCLRPRSRSGSCARSVSSVPSISR